jgi:hypothetical protein
MTEIGFQCELGAVSGYQADRLCRATSRPIREDTHGIDELLRALQQCACARKSRTIASWHSATPSPVYYAGSEGNYHTNGGLSAIRLNLRVALRSYLIAARTPQWPTRCFMPPASVSAAYPFV